MCQQDSKCLETLLPATTTISILGVLQLPAGITIYHQSLPLKGIQSNKSPHAFCRGKVQHHSALLERAQAKHHLAFILFSSARCCEGQVHISKENQQQAQNTRVTILPKVAVEFLHGDG
jgi:hypothetical protein